MRSASGGAVPTTNPAPLPRELGRMLKRLKRNPFAIFPKEIVSLIQQLAHRRDRISAEDMQRARTALQTNAETYQRLVRLIDGAE